jgi:hypothetical protein
MNDELSFALDELRKQPPGRIWFIRVFSASVRSVNFFIKRAWPIHAIRKWPE